MVVGEGKASFLPVLCAPPSSSPSAPSSDRLFIIEPHCLWGSGRFKSHCLPSPAIDCDAGRHAHLLPLHCGPAAPAARGGHDFPAAAQPALVGGGGGGGGGARGGASRARARPPWRLPGLLQPRGL